MSSPAATQQPQLKPHEYAELGFHLVPWANRTAKIRKPLVTNWLENKPSTATVMRWEDQFPDCDWAIVPVDHVVLDIEMKNGLNGEQDLLNLFPDVDWSVYPQTKTFSGGRHIWMRLPDGWTKKGGVHIADGLEVKCRNGSAHIPPSTGYNWIRRLDAFEIPVAPDVFLDVWRECRPVSQVVDPTVPVPAGGRHAFLCGVAGKLINSGVQGDILFTMLRTLANERCEKPEEVSDEEIRGIADSYNEKDADSFELRLIKGEEAAVSVEAFFSRPVAPRADVEEQPADVESLHLSDSDLRPTALIASWVDWILDGANRKQPELSLLSACVGIATCIGRKLVWRGSHANLYGMGLASSGSGKNDPHNSIQKVLEAAGFSDLVGASDIGSDAGLLTQISNKPEIVWPIDEFSIVLEYMHKPNAPAYITYLSKYLLGLFTCDPYNGKALKNEDPLVIPNPYPNLLTWAQPKTFLSVFDEKMANSGFIGRFIIFVGEDLPRLNARAMKKPIPQELIEGLKMARSATHQLFKSIGATRDTVEIEASDDVIEHYFTKVEETEDIVQKHRGTIQGTLWARTTEKANKFALIHAWSLNPAKPVMTKESIDWGFRVVYFANRSLIKLLDSRVVNVQDEHTKFMFDYIDGRKNKGATTGEIAVKCSRIERLRRAAILQDLIDGGKIVAIRSKGARGPAGIRYFSSIYTPEKEQT